MLDSRPDMPGWHGFQSHLGQLIFIKNLSLIFSVNATSWSLLVLYHCTVMIKLNFTYLYLSLLNIDFGTLASKRTPSVCHFHGVMMTF